MNTPFPELLPCTKCVFAVGSKVLLAGRHHWGELKVVRVSGYVGLDGRHWLSVEAPHDHVFASPCEELKEAP